MFLLSLIVKTWIMDTGMRI